MVHATSSAGTLILPLEINATVVQSPTALIVVLTGFFNYTDVWIDIVYVGLYQETQFIVNVECYRASENIGESSYSTWTDLGSPYAYSPGTYEVFIRSVDFEITLKRFSFEILRPDVFLSTANVSGSLLALVGEKEWYYRTLVAPALYKYMRFLMNSTDKMTLGINLTNVGAQALENLSVLLDPGTVPIEIDPVVNNYGTLEPGSSPVGPFNLTTTNVGVGLYNMSYVIDYEIGGKPYSLNGKIPFGIALDSCQWIASNETGKASFTTPWLDNGTVTVDNYTTVTVSTSEEDRMAYLWQNITYDYVPSAFTSNTSNPFIYVVSSMLGLVALHLEYTRSKTLAMETWYLNATLGAMMASANGYVSEGMTKMLMGTLIESVWVEVGKFVAGVALILLKAGTLVGLFVITDFLLINTVLKRIVHDEGEEDTGEGDGDENASPPPDEKPPVSSEPPEPPPVPEFPLGFALELALILLMVYIAWRSKLKIKFSTSKLKSSHWNEYQA